jgi:tagatose 6-phosphate kinase
MIICLGPTPAVQKSMTFDRLTIDAVNRTGNVSQYASGKSINAARVLYTLGVTVCCTGFSGGDTGTFLLADLESVGIAHRFVQVSAPTRMCITLVDRAGQTATELIEESKPVEPAAYAQLLEVLRSLLPESDGVVLSGSLTPGAPADFYARCVAAVVSAGKPVLLDATGEPLRQALASGPTVIKPNRSELSQTVGTPTDTDDQLKSAIVQLLSKGPKWAVVTAGAKETVVSNGVHFWKIGSPKVDVVSPIGSGDSFAAGLMAGIVAGQSVPDACRLAAACGSANAMTDKAGHLSRGIVEELAARVQVAPF